jgi:hypothetical protein
MDIHEVTDLNQIRDFRDNVLSCNHALAFVAKEEGSTVAVGVGCPVCKTLLPGDAVIFCLRAPKAEISIGTVAEMIDAVNGSGKCFTSREDCTLS